MRERGGGLQYPLGKLLPSDGVDVMPDTRLPQFVGYAAGRDEDEPGLLCQVRMLSL